MVITPKIPINQNCFILYDNEITEFKVGSINIAIFGNCKKSFNVKELYGLFDQTGEFVCIVSQNKVFSTKQELVKSLLKKS